MRSAIAARKGINISGHYVVSLNAMPFYILCKLNNKKIERSDRTVFYITFKTQRPPDAVF